jgi:hypothetical protein
MNVYMGIYGDFNGNLWMFENGIPIECGLWAFMNIIRDAD